MKKINYLHILLILFVYSLFVFFKQGDALKYRFNEELIPRYLRSQDIEDVEDKIKDRIFISDSEIYIASGYLYAKGESPTSYNFWHAPLIKYLFGFSTIIFNNPFLVQIVLGGVLLILTYILGYKVFKSVFVGLLSSAFLLIDPLFSNMISEGLLDLGQAVFSLGYVMAFLLLRGNFMLQGILLGLISASKFWTTAIFLMSVLYFYKLVLKKEKIAVKKLLLIILVAFITFSLVYTKAFIDNGGKFNLFFWQLKSLKLLINHDVSTYFGGSIVLFLTGYFMDWWNRADILRTQVWSPLWPITFLISFYNLISSKKNSKSYVIYLLPILYLLYTATGVPFSRYFILILPYFYLGLSKTLVGVAKKLIP